MYGAVEPRIGQNSAEYGEDPAAMPTRLIATWNNVYPSRPRIMTVPFEDIPLQDMPGAGERGMVRLSLWLPSNVAPRVAVCHLSEQGEVLKAADQSQAARGGSRSAG